VPQGQSGQARKISPPLGFDPRIVQPVASRYTDYATRPTKTEYTGLKKILRMDDFKVIDSQHAMMINNFKNAQKNYLKPMQRFGSISSVG